MTEENRDGLLTILWHFSNFVEPLLWGGVILAVIWIVVGGR